MKQRCHVGEQENGQGDDGKRTRGEQIDTSQEMSGGRGGGEGKNKATQVSEWRGGKSETVWLILPRASPLTGSSNKDD